MAGSQEYVDDPRNARALIYLNGALVPRNEAKVSIFDAGFVLGDGVWEGLRLHQGGLVFLEQHLDRLYWGAKEIALNIGLSREEIKAALWRTLDANEMSDGVHLRLMVTRGFKKTVNQDPRNAIGVPTIVIVAEHKLPSLTLIQHGLALATSSIRCTPAHMFDMRLNSHSRLNLIRALVEVIDQGADEALMLDPEGFVSSCNATNFFFVRDGVLCTSTGEFCFNGVTRANVIALAQENGFALQIANFTLDDLNTAQEAFVTGTFGGITPVRSIDGQVLPASLPGPITQQMCALYDALKDAEALKGCR